MAAEDEGKTEQPTAKKLTDARNKGNVARSPDLTNGVMLLVAVLILWIFGGRMWDMMQENFTQTVRLIPTYVLSDVNFTTLLVDQTLGILKMLYPMLLVLMVFGVIANLLQFGFMFNLDQIMPKMERLFNMKAITNMFAKDAMIELLKGLFKMAIVGYFAYDIIKSNYTEMIVMSDMDNKAIVGKIFSMSFEMMIKIALLMLFIGILDMLYRKRDYVDKLKMTKQEVKDEYKMMDGDPKIKQRMRQMQMQMHQKFMMNEVPGATVVITNPTFIAIALRYDRGSDESPVVVAKGKRLIAQKIRDLAGENRIPIVENKPLARSMFDVVVVGEPIPAEFFSAVAEVLAYVYSRERTHA